MRFLKVARECWGVAIVMSPLCVLEPLTKVAEADPNATAGDAVTLGHRLARSRDVVSISRCLQPARLRRGAARCDQAGSEANQLLLLWLDYMVHWLDHSTGTWCAKLVVQEGGNSSLTMSPVFAPRLPGKARCNSGIGKNQPVLLWLDYMVHWLDHSLRYVV